MALDVNTLVDGLMELSGPTGACPKSIPAAGQAWAKAYRKYADACEAAGVGPPTSLASAEATFAAALTSAFTAGFGGLAPASIAAQIATAAAAFWLFPPVTFSGVRGGSLVSLVPGTPACAATIGGIFETKPDTAMADIARALHALTKTVQVFSPIPIPPITVGLV